MVKIRLNFRKISSSFIQFNPSQTGCFIPFSLSPKKEIVFFPAVAVLYLSVFRLFFRPPPGKDFNFLFSLWKHACASNVKNHSKDDRTRSFVMIIVAMLSITGKMPTPITTSVVSTIPCGAIGAFWKTCYGKAKKWPKHPGKNWLQQVLILHSTPIPTKTKKGSFIPLCMNMAGCHSTKDCA